MLPAIERVAVEESVRLTVCVDCMRRPARSERWGASVPRDCEPACPVFENLDQLRTIVRNAASGSIHRHELHVIGDVCRGTCTHKRDGGACRDYADADCPLSARGGLTLATLSAISNLRDDSDPQAWRRGGERL